MNKNELIEKNTTTLNNLQRSMNYMLSFDGNKYKQHKILHAAFKRTNIILKNRMKKLKLR